MEDNLALFMQRVAASSPRYEIHDGDDLVWLLSDIGFPLFNSILRMRGSAESVGPAVAAAVARGRARRVPLLWWVAPQTAPAALGDELAAHGFTMIADMPGMTLDLRAFVPRADVPASLTITRVADRETAAIWCRTLCEGFGMPAFVADAFLELLVDVGFAPDAPLHDYLGWWNGEPVATATLFHGGGIAGVYDIATVAGARRRGIGAAMTQHALLDAQAHGATTAALQASELGADLYRALGFVERCRFVHYLWYEAPPAAP